MPSWSYAPSVAVLACWFAFAAIFLIRKRPKAEKESKRDNRAFFPIFLQGVSYAFVWGIRRDYRTPLPGPAPSLLIGFLAVVIGVGSVTLVLHSVRTLGKQWALAARLVEGHQLITSGPYGCIRNPIYTGMFGMLLATGMVASPWWAVAIGSVMFLAATAWRVRVEERLLRSQFGEEFEDYARRVSSLIPYIW